MIRKEWLRENFRAIFFYIYLFLFLFAFNLTSKDYDYDLWARLIIGKYFVQTGHILKHDFLSYTPTHTLYDHEWGSSIIFYLTHHYFSHFGLLLLQVILVFFMFVVIIKTIKLRGLTTTTPYNFVFYFFAFSAMGEGLIAEQIIRCQLFTFLFFAVYLYILELARKDFNKTLWLLPILMLIWNNLHGGCVAGIGLIILYIIGESINRKPVKKYLIPLLLSIVVLPINPWGFAYINFLLMATTMNRPEIIEFFSIFHKIFAPEAFIDFKYLASLMILFEIIYIIKSILSKTLKLDATKIIVVITTLALALIHVKFIPISMIALIVFLYDDFYSIFNYLTLNIINKYALAKDILVYVLCSIFILQTIFNKELYKPAVSWERYPIKSIEFIKENNIKGNLLVNFGYGSYASYKLYPQNKIYMDGRYEEVYYAYMLPDLNKFQKVTKGWDNLLKKAPTDIIIIEYGFPAYKKLLSMSDWSCVFEDINYGVFVKTKNLKEKYKMPPDKIDYYKEHLFDTDIDFKDKQWQKK